MSIDDDIHNSIILTAILLALVTVFVLLRVYIRLFVVNAFSWDDVLLMGSAAMFAVMVGLGWKGNSLGDINYATADEYSLYLKLFMIEVVFWLASTTFLKISICIFLLRLAVRPAHKWCIRASGVLYTCASIAFIIILLLYCSPTAYYWDKSIEGGSCKSLGFFYTAVLVNGILGSCTDFALSVLPAWIMWDVQLERRTKVSVCVILGLGLLSSAATIVRLTYLRPLVYSTAFTAETISFANWSAIEPAMGIIAASLVTMRSLLRYIFAKLGLTSLGTSRKYTGGASGNNSHMGFRKPQRSGYIRSETTKDSSYGMNDLVLRPEQLQQDKSMGVAVNVTAGRSPIQPGQGGNGWNVTRVDQWSVSEKSLNSTHSLGAKEPSVSVGERF